MKLTITKNDKKKSYDIDFFSYIPNDSKLILKVKGNSGLIPISPDKWDKIEIEKE